MASTEASQTRALLEAHHAGDPAAIRKLIALHHDAIKSIVRRQLNRRLRKFGDTGDFLNQILVRILGSGPRFVISDASRFRELLVCLVRNALRDWDRQRYAQRRNPGRERRLPTRISIIDLDVYDAANARPLQPDAAAQENEEIELAGLALEMLSTDERRVVDLRHDGASFEKIGAENGITAEGARKRYGRAVRRLREIMRGLTSRDIDSAIDAASRSVTDRPSCRLGR